MIYGTILETTFQRAVEDNIVLSHDRFIGRQDSFSRVFKSICITWDSGAAAEGAAQMLNSPASISNKGDQIMESCPMNLAMTALAIMETWEHVPTSKQIYNWSHHDTWSLCTFPGNTYSPS